jgi:hypothetical protein
MRIDTVLDGMIFIPGNVPSSKNSKQIVRSKTGIPFLTNSKLSYNYKKDKKSVFAWFRIRFEKMKLGGPNAFSSATPMIYLGFYFVRDSRRKFDFNNASQILCDLMVEHKWIEDDNASFLTPVFLGYEVDTEDPGVYLTVMDGEYESCVKKVLNRMGL